MSKDGFTIFTRLDLTHGCPLGSTNLEVSSGIKAALSGYFSSTPRNLPRSDHCLLLASLLSNFFMLSRSLLRVSRRAVNGLPSAFVKFFVSLFLELDNLHLDSITRGGEERERERSECVCDEHLFSLCIMSHRNFCFMNNGFQEF